jgi:hypothetical protein
VLGTGDLSELALGWATHGVGDQMSHYNVSARLTRGRCWTSSCDSHSAAPGPHNAASSRKLRLPLAMEAVA